MPRATAIFLHSICKASAAHANHFQMKNWYVCINGWMGDTHMHVSIPWSLWKKHFFPNQENIGGAFAISVESFTMWCAKNLRGRKSSDSERQRVRTSVRVRARANVCSIVAKLVVMQFLCRCVWLWSKWHMEAHYSAICLFSSSPLLYNGTRLVVSFRLRFTSRFHMLFHIPKCSPNAFSKGKKRRKIGRQKYVCTFPHAYTTALLQRHHHHCYVKCVQCTMNMCVRVHKWHSHSFSNRRPNIYIYTHTLRGLLEYVRLWECVNVWVFVRIKLYFQMVCVCVRSYGTEVCNCVDVWVWMKHHLCVHDMMMTTTTTTISTVQWEKGRFFFVITSFVFGVLILSPSIAIEHN